MIDNEHFAPVAKQVETISHTREMLCLSKPPVPANGDRYRAFFVWHFSSNDSILQSITYTQELIDTCGKYGYNMVLLGVEPFLSPKGYTLENENGIRKVVRALRLSGIEVHAVMGQGGTYGDGYARAGHGYGSEKQWAIDNILKPIQGYNVRAPEESKFQGFLLDNEYYNGGGKSYTEEEIIGTFKLLHEARAMLPGLRIGHTPSWMLGHADHCHTVNYSGRVNLEGFHILDQCDYVVIQTYRNDPDLQMSLLKPWINYAAGTGKHVGVILASDADSPDHINPGFTYNTLREGDRIRFEGSMAHISKAYQARFGMQGVWWGNAVETYHDYKMMK